MFSKPMCEDLSTLLGEFLYFVLTIGLHLHMGVCDGGADMTYRSGSGDTCKCGVKWLMKEVGILHMLMMHLNACRVSMSGDITRKVKAQSMH